MNFNQQNDYVVETSLVGTVMNGLSHLHGCKDHDQFIINLIRGLGGNLNMKSRLEFTREVRNIFQPLSNHILQLFLTLKSQHTVLQSSGMQPLSYEFMHLVD